MDILAHVFFSIGTAGVMMLHPAVRRWIFTTHREVEIEEPADGTVQWRVDKGASYCVKCTSWSQFVPSDKSIRPRAFEKICECAEYPKPHFHFVCTHCSFKTIMRTADDP